MSPERLSRRENEFEYESPPRSTILGTTQRKDSRLTLPALVLGGFVLTFGGYASGVFSVSGGALFIPFYAVIVGVLAAFWVGYAKSGLLFAWLVAYAPMLGYHVQDALLGAREQSLGERLTYLVNLEAFVVLGVEAIIFGTVAFAVGSMLRGVFDLFQEPSRTTPSGKRD